MFTVIPIFKEPFLHPLHKDNGLSALWVQPESAEEPFFIIQKHPDSDKVFDDFDRILDERGTEHGIEFLVKWMNGEESWIHYDCIPESFILEEGRETHDMRDIPEAPDDESDFEWNGSDEDFSDEDELEDEYDEDSAEESEAQFTDYDEYSSEDESEDEEETNLSNRKRPAEGQDSLRKRRKPASSR